MIYLLNGSWLPWINIASEFPEYDLKDWLKERLNFQYTQEFFEMVPKSLRSTIKKVLMLDFEDEPPYDLIIDKLKKELLKNVELGPDMQPIGHCFEWNISEAETLKKALIRQET
jgi:hypothetical protein